MEVHVRPDSAYAVFVSLTFHWYFSKRNWQFTKSFHVFLVAIGCGGQSSENQTYFEVSNAGSGECTARICSQPNVCQVNYIWKIENGVMWWVYDVFRSDWTSILLSFPDLRQPQHQALIWKGLQDTLIVQMGLLKLLWGDAAQRTFLQYHMLQVYHHPFVVHWLVIMVRFWTGLIIYQGL